MLTLDHLKIDLPPFHLSANTQIPPGAKCAIVGPSGAGKSTLLAAIAGFQPLASGQITWSGKVLDPNPARRPVSIVFQDHNLFPHLTAAQNVGLGLRADLKLSAEQVDQVEVALDQVGLSGLGQRKPAKLSGGQIARVALARILLQDRPMLLLDEPFGALGPALKSEMLALVSDLVAQSQMTLLMVTHDPDDARAICEQAILVADDVVHPPKPIKPFFDAPPEVLRRYLGNSPSSA